MQNQHKVINNAKDIKEMVRGLTMEDDGYVRIKITKDELELLKQDPDIQCCFGFEFGGEYYYSGAKLEVI